MSSNLRRHDLDWVRVLAVLLLVPFHSALIFSLSPEHMVYIKDRVESPLLLAMDGFIYIWHMPLLFVVAGAATWFALQRRTAGQYVRERVLRLLVPLAFALLTVIPLMTYVHYLGRANPPALLEHYSRFLTINARDLGGMRGYFTPAHLWFILFLFVFSLAALPLFLWLRRESSAALRQTLGRILSVPGALILLILPLVLLSLLPGLADKNPFYFLGLFIIGFVLMVDERITQAIARSAPWILVIAIITTLIYFAPYFIPLPQVYRKGTAAAYGYEFAYQLGRWTWSLTLLGFAHRHLTRETRFLRYTSEAAYPFYILHLPVNTLVGFFVIQLDASIGVKYVLINLFTFALTFLAYELVIRRVGLMRFLFGMKPLSRADQAAAARQLRAA